MRTITLGMLALALLAAWSLAVDGSPDAEAEGDGATVSDRDVPVRPAARARDR